MDFWLPIDIIVRVRFLLTLEAEKTPLPCFLVPPHFPGVLPACGAPRWGRVAHSQATKRVWGRVVKSRFPGRRGAQQGGDTRRRTALAGTGSVRQVGAPLQAALPGAGRPRGARGSAAVTSRPGLAVSTRPRRFGAKRLPGRRGYTERAVRPRRPASGLRSGPVRGLAGRRRRAASPRSLWRRRAAGAMSQRQVLQGRAGRAPRRLAAEAGTTGRPAPRCVSLQCSSSTRKPVPSSFRWWQRWRPDPRTSRRCRTRVRPRP